jgi:adenine-specific DNA-methyltransferase
MPTPYHAATWATALTLNEAPDSASGLSLAIGNARVDLNPHQVDAALFALRSPLAMGAILANEVGLGKTIEAALVMAQRWAEGRRRILNIVPASLRKQWQQELLDKFFLPGAVVDGPAFRTKGAPRSPLDITDAVVIVSYQLAAAKRDEIAAIPWDLVQGRERTHCDGRREAVAVPADAAHGGPGAHDTPGPGGEIRTAGVSARARLIDFKERVSS